MLNHSLAKPVFFIVCLSPLVWIFSNALTDNLGANPVEAITHQTGEWTLRLLLVTLLITPLKNWTGNPGWIRFRRMAGLFVYFYACCHFTIWFLADHGLDLISMLNDIVERPYITLGFAAFLLLTPLAITSNNWSMRKLGKRWKKLHRVSYAILILGVVHFIWLVKADYLEPLIYAAIGTGLLLARVQPLKSLRLISRQSV
jgi:sulfoxide reductase heme-binding subunit YedZ